ncbi:MAG: hypothetical protein DSM106950_01870 [Stigonema ocellatum SAG 48.90 = DSM 106950]|nr:hypothetical protein [Stigonema ocellatum SAG 48.90 = DSM 106950]
MRTLVVTAIHGLGSVGKSTLATALAHDLEVKTHFCDGIFWATLGQQPNLLSLLSGWVQVLGDYNFKATSVEAASNQLRTLLYEKAVLLVVDDAWNTQDVQLFNVGGARCQVLVTTREAGIAQVLGASTYSLDVMQPSQAMELLTKKLGRNLTATETQSAEVLAKELGYLPLALELAAAQVAGGISWKVLLQDMQQEVARLKTLDNKLARDANDEASLKKLSLTASLNLSVQRLSKETQENFILLGILPEDVTITQQMAVTLWDMDLERDASDELGYLHSKALLLSGVSLVDGTLTYRLHDLFHDLARNLLTASPTPKRRGDLPGLGITLAHAHATVLEKYRQKTQDGLWHTLPNDGYIHQHLVWHLEKAKKVEEIHSLLREESKTGANGWYEACDRLGQTANFVSDVVRAWRLAEEMFEKNPSSISLQVRYALIQSSINSRAKNIPPTLLAALVEKKRWTVNQGLAYARQIPDPGQQAEALVRLARFLSSPEQIQQEALNIALAIQHPENRGQVLEKLTPHLPEPMQRKILTGIQEIKIDWWKGEILARLAPFLPESLVQEILRTVKQTIAYEYIKFRAWARIIPYISQSEQRTENQSLQTALIAILDTLDINTVRLGIIGDNFQLVDYHRIAPDIFQDRELKNYIKKLENYIGLVPYLSSSVQQQLRSTLSEILNGLRSNSIQGERRQYTGVGRGRLSEEEVDRLVEQLQKSNQSHINPSIKTDLLDNYISQGSLDDALDKVQKIQDQAEQLQLLVKFVNDVGLSESAIGRTIEIARQIRDSEQKEKSLIKLIPHLSDTRKEEILDELLKEITNSKNTEKFKANKLISLIRQFPKDCPTKVIVQAFEIAKQITEREQQEEVLLEMIPHLSNTRKQEILDELLREIGKIIDDNEENTEKFKANKLIRLIRQFSKDCPTNVIVQAFEIAKQITEREEQEEVFIKLIPYLQNQQLEYILCLARTSDYQSLLALIIAHLIPTIEKKEPLLKEALDAVNIIRRNRQLSNPSERKVEILRKLAPYLSEKTQESQTLLEQALKLAREINEDLPKVRVLTELFNLNLSDSMKETILRQEVLSSTHQVWQTMAFTELGSFFPESLLTEAQSVVQNVILPWNKLKMLKALIKHKPNLLRDALTIAREIQTQEGHAEALLELVPLLDENTQKSEMIREILTYFVAIDAEHSRVGQLQFLAPYMAEIPNSSLHKFWCETLEILARRTRKDLLSDLGALIPVINSLGEAQAIEEIASAIQDVSRWWG